MAHTGIFPHLSEETLRLLYEDLYRAKQVHPHSKTLDWWLDQIEIHWALFGLDVEERLELLSDDFRRGLY